VTQPPQLPDPSRPADGHGGPSDSPSADSELQKAATILNWFTIGLGAAFVWALGIAAAWYVLSR